MRRGRQVSCRLGNRAPATQILTLSRRDCDSCPTNQCVPAANDNSSPSSHGISSGAVAGAVIASVIFLAAVIVTFLWYRKRQRVRRSTSAGDVKSDVPARAEDVLNRPDPNEKPGSPQPQEMHTVRIFGGGSNTTINLDPESQGDSVAATQGHTHPRESVQSNPFADGNSIQSASTGAQSNVIPIGLEPPGSVSIRSDNSSSGSSGPQRPVRSPDLNLNLDHANVLSDNPRSDAKSTRSGIRNSYMTTGSFASDLLNEAPVIITSSQSQVKQVMGIVKAEVIRTPPGTPCSPTDSMISPGSLSVAGSRPAVPSPLAGSSFGPSDSVAEEQDKEAVASSQVLSVRTDPFGDEHSPYPANASPTTTSRTSLAISTTFGDNEQQWDSPTPRNVWTSKRNEPRPTSVNTQAGSIIGATISNASRVHLGLDHPPTPARVSTNTLLVSPASEFPLTPLTPVSAATPGSAALSPTRSQRRMTSAKIITPASDSEATITPSLPTGVLQRQQRRALEDMDASRMSRSSVVSSTSTRADSILEGFPFVPPSPISDRPLRTPPRSPLGQQAFTDVNAANASNAGADAAAPLPPPPNRKVLGMSTGSQSSTVSNGLGSFPFQIDSGAGAEPTQASSPPSSFSGRQRASLDTLALTADLTSYPLGFDRNAAMANYPGASNRR